MPFTEHAFLSFLWISTTWWKAIRSLVYIQKELTKLFSAKLRIIPTLIIDWFNCSQTTYWTWSAFSTVEIAALQVTTLTCILIEAIIRSNLAQKLIWLTQTSSLKCREACFALAGAILFWINHPFRILRQSYSITVHILVAYALHACRTREMSGVYTKIRGLKYRVACQTLTGAVYSINDPFWVLRKIDTYAWHIFITDTFWSWRAA